MSDKPLVWLSGEIKTPPFSEKGRQEVGDLLRQLQTGENLSMPRSRPMPSIGASCHELRVNDAGVAWRVIYRIDGDAIVIGAVFQKSTRTTPRRVLDECKRRFRTFDEHSR